MWRACSRNRRSCSTRGSFPRAGVERWRGSRAAWLASCVARELHPQSARFRVPRPPAHPAPLPTPHLCSPRTPQAPPHPCRIPRAVPKVRSGVRASHVLHRSPGARCGALAVTRALPGSRDAVVVGCDPANPFASGAKGAIRGARIPRFAPLAACRALSGTRAERAVSRTPAHPAPLLTPHPQAPPHPCRIPRAVRKVRSGVRASHVSHRSRGAGAGVGAGRAARGAGAGAGCGRGGGRAARERARAAGERVIDNRFDNGYQ